MEEIDGRWVGGGGRGMNLKKVDITNKKLYSGYPLIENVKVVLIRNVECEELGGGNNEGVRK